MVLNLLSAGYDGPPPVTVGRLVGTFAVEPALAAGLLASLFLYLLGVRRLHQRGDAWNRWRTASFLLGIGLVAYATMGGLATYDGVLFSAHMAQHMILAMVAPLPLALSAPITLALRTLPARPRGWLLTALHSWFGRLLSRPLVGLAIFAGSPILLYFTSLYPLSLEHPWVHALVHLHFLLSGCVFLWPLVGVDPLPSPAPHWARALVMFLALPFHAFLGLILLSGSRVLAAAHYAALARPWGASPLADQRTGGGLLWASGDFISAAIFITLVAQWARADEREAVRADRRMDRDDSEYEAYNARLAALAEADAQRPAGR